MWRKIINALAILISLFCLGSMLGFLPIDINAIEVPLLALVGAIAIINVSVSSKIRLVRPGRYTENPSTFVNRNSQVNGILQAAVTGRNIINLFGMTGIGVTRLQQFTADLINKKLPYKLRRKYCEKPLRVLGLNYRSYYLNASSITNVHDILSMITETILIEGNINSITKLCEVLKPKLKINSKRLILFFDGIYNREQMFLIEEFAAQYFPLRPNDTIVLGTHHKSLSYQHHYGYIEILEFNKNDLMILAKAYNVTLDERASIQLYEITEGIPMFAYLLLKDNSAIDVFSIENTQDIYAYLKQFVVPSMTTIECQSLEKIALLSLSVPVMGKQELQLIGLNDDYSILSILYDKGLIQFSAIRKEVSVSHAIAKAFLAYSLTQENLCTKLYLYYKKINKDHLAILYLLLSKNFTSTDENYIEIHLKAWLDNKDILVLLLALSPSVELSINIKEKSPKLYILYIYSCVYTFSSIGDYPKAKGLLNQIIVDGIIVKRYDCDLDELDFALHFLWADVEHLLNNYSTAIDILDNLIDNSHTFDKLDRLPQLYWMKAHCLRHQAKNLNESLQLYEKCNNLAITYKQNEYIIRSLHGQICIAFITQNSTFDFEKKFSLLEDIYLVEPQSWHAYKYNTLKYKSIYYRVFSNDKFVSLALLQESLKGFTSIKKRNIYDVYFEFGEYHRYNKEYEESRKAYIKCNEFAKHNLDYNLESLSQIGLILVDIELGINVDPALLIAIQKKALEKDLHLTVKYANQLQQYIKNEIDQPIIRLFNP